MLNKYVLIIIWIGLIALLSKQERNLRQEIVEEELVYRYKPAFAFLVSVPIILMATSRGWFGDSSLYILNYFGMPNTFSEIPHYMETVPKDRVFSFISAVIHAFFSNDYQIYFLIIATIQMILVVNIFRKYSEEYVLSLFLFIASADYISNMFNGMRQFMAVVLTLLAAPFVLRKDYLKAVIIILLASTFHRSALLVLPFLFIVTGDVWNKKTILFLTLIVISMAFVTRFTSIMNDILSVTQYSNMVSDYQEWKDDGTNPLRVLVYSIPTIWSWIERRRIRGFNNPVANLCVNMSIVSTGFYLISMVTSGVFIGRIPIYFSLYNYILLPWELNNLSDRNRDIMMLCTIGLYLFYYYYIMHFQNGLL